MSAHTPGTWATKAQGDANFYATRIDGRWLAVIQFNGELLVAEQEANARLIDAASDLLAACQAALLREDIADDELGGQIRAAIAKATGEAA